MSVLTTADATFPAVNNDILWETMDHMDLTQLVALKATCQRSDHLVASYLNHKFRQLLLRFVTNPSGFRQMMRDTDAVISGSCATAFMLPTTVGWEGADLDLYVPFSQFDRVLGYLSSVAQFTLDPTAHQDVYDIEGVAQIARLVHLGVRVDVIRSRTSTALHPLPFFWMTAVMNFLSADSFCSAYPQLTTALCGIINSNNVSLAGIPNARTHALVEKYAARGFDLRGHAPEWSHHTEIGSGAQKRGNCPYTTRVFGDEYCVRVSLDPFSAGLRDIIDRQHITVTWRRGGSSCGHGCAAMGELRLLEVEDVSTD